jgi:uncharacterized repeat protein (TIGR03803 family)
VSKIDLLISFIPQDFWLDLKRCSSMMAQNITSNRSMRTLLLLLILVAVGSASGQQQEPTSYTESVLYSFCSQANCADGWGPYASLIEDASGSFYGTTIHGGSNEDLCSRGCGTVFKLDALGNYIVLHNFCSQPNCSDGNTPYGSLTKDASGNIYGTAQFGGINSIGGGTVFKLDSAGNYTVLYKFCSLANCTDGEQPFAGLIEDASGNLYGTTSLGGAYNSGTVFKLDSAGNYTVLYNFCSQANCADGWGPYAGLIEDASGNLYGTTFWGGGTIDGGTVFKLDSAGNYTVLHTFCSQVNCTDGYHPYAGLIKDASGSLYGTTYNGGATNNGLAPGGGTVFKLDSAGQFTVLHMFCSQPNCTDGGGPQSSLIEDSSGNFYGTTSIGGAHEGAGLGGEGTTFKLDNVGNYTVLYSFCSQANCTDGSSPYAGLIEDASGNIYGTTISGGSMANSNVSGVIFKLTTPDFAISANPATVTISSPGQQGTIAVAITPAGGFNQTITPSCSGLPAGASCSFSPSSVTPSGGVVNTTLTIATMATSSAIRHWPLADKQNLSLALVLPGFFMLMPAKRGKRRSAKRAAVLVLLLGFSIMGLNGCGGGSASTGGADGGAGGGGGTPAGTYTVTITATASSSRHATTLTLVVE